jgi:hypothetical protein
MSQPAEPEHQGVNASDTIAKMARLVKEAEASISPIIGELKNKQLQIEEAEKRYDAAMNRLKKVAALAGPGGEFEAEIHSLRKLGDKAIARLEHHNNPKLRSLVNSVYKPKIEQLNKHLEELKKTHGDILRKIRDLEDEKELVVELSRASLYADAVALVGKGVNEYKEMGQNLEKIQADVKQTEEGLAGFTAK